MKTNNVITWIGGLFMLVLLINSCEDSLDGTTFFTTDGTTNEMTIIEVLERNPDKFSMYLEILEKTDFYNSLKSYGNYTCLAPTNTAIKAYLESEFNVSTVAELNSEEQVEFLKILVKFHTLPSGRTTSGFIEGRLADTTYTGDYLTTSYLLGGGISNVQINREVGLEEYDIRTNNGIIHALNGVLSPYIDPVPVVMDKSGNYTIFVQALKETGYYDYFSVVYNEAGSKNNFTILAETDEIYAQEGINSFQELVAKISPDNSDFLDPDNDLNRFVGYHATQNFLYTANFPEDAFINTILPRNAIKSFKTDKELKLNETETGENDTWTSIINAESNFPAKNGVYHTVNKLFTIFTPKPKWVIFDVVSDQPEVQSRLIRSNNKVPSTAWEFIRWFPEGNKRFLGASKYINLNYNILDVGGYAWIEFDTPVLPKGKYEMRICSNGSKRGRGVFQIYWDGEPVGSVYDLNNQQNLGWPDVALMESKGWRPGYEWITNKAGENQAENLYTNSFIVTKELLCPEQKRHVFRMETITSGGSPIDYIEWIPVE